MLFTLHILQFLVHLLQSRQLVIHILLPLVLLRLLRPPLLGLLGLTLALRRRRGLIPLCYPACILQRLISLPQPTG